jgi:pyridoxine 4-dehydrogenase
LGEQIAEELPLECPLLAQSGHWRNGNATSSQVREARRIAHVVSVQNHYNLVHRADDALVDELAADGIPCVPFFPLGGFSPLQSDEARR